MNDNIFNDYYDNEASTSNRINKEKSIKLASDLESSIDIWDDASSDDDIFNNKQKCFNKINSENVHKTQDKIKNFDNPWDAIEEMTNKLKIVNEKNLINLDDSVNNLVLLNEDEYQNYFRNESNKQNTSNQLFSDETLINPRLLPRQAIIYDYTIQPVKVYENKRKYLPHFNTISEPFLRPIVIDGVGLVKAYRNCCCTNLIQFPFPIVPIIRCMFYWISKGHSTVLCFPSLYNPLDCSEFNANNNQKNALETLKRFKLCTIFNTTCEQDNMDWYANILNNYRACLITTVSQWHLLMPNDLESGVMIPHSDDFKSYKFIYNKKINGKCPERLLQPFFSHEGKLVFFSSFSAAGACVADMILETSILNFEEYQQFNENQLSFIEQAKMLKALYSFLPETSRFRETSVMVKILSRLQPFLP